MSIHKPTCPSCGLGTMNYALSNSETTLEKNRGPQLIHYLFALILIIFAIVRFLCRTQDKCEATARQLAAVIEAI